MVEDECDGPGSVCSARAQGRPARSRCGSIGASPRCRPGGSRRHPPAHHVRVGRSASRGMLEDPIESATQGRSSVDRRPRGHLETLPRGTSRSSRASNSWPSWAWSRAGPRACRHRRRSCTDGNDHVSADAPRRRRPRTGRPSRDRRAARSRAPGSGRRPPPAPPACREVEVVEADLTDPTVARRAMAGAAVVYHAASAPYDRWPELLPPIMRGVLDGAAATRARIVYADNLYAYGPVDGPLTEDLPSGRRARTAASGPPSPTS